MLLGGKHGFGEIRASCEAGLVGSGSMVGGSISAKVADRRELMSPGGLSSFGAWGTVTCAMAACASPGVAVLHQTPAKDWLHEFDSVNL